MATVNETYESLTQQIFALVGADLSTNEKTRVDSLINLAAKRAYRQSEWWERFLVIGEPRSAARQDIVDTSNLVIGTKRTTRDNVIESTDTGIDATVVTLSADAGASPRDVLGDYEFIGYKNGLAEYERSGHSAKYRLFYDKTDTNWKVTTTDYATEYVESADGGSFTVPTTGWAQVTGTFANPALAYKTTPSVIDTLLLVHQYEPYRDVARRGIATHPVPEGVQLETAATPDYAYVTYKKQNVDASGNAIVYGDGAGGATTSVIPGEWFNYMSLYAAYMFQVSESKTDANNRVIAMREVDAALQDELMKIEAQGIAETVGKQVYTYSSVSTVLN